MGKVGRPGKNVTKNKRIELRLSEKDMDLLEDCSRETGLNKSEIIRNNLRMCCNMSRYNAKNN